MGCDIHLYVEYTKKNDKREDVRWRDFGGRINPGRNYRLFGIMSKGVRSDSAFSFDPKGLPEHLSYSSNADAFLYISEAKDEGNCTLEQAQEWGGKIIDWEGSPQWTEHPDWHSHSWLTTSEYSQALDFYNKNSEWGDEPEYEAILSAMKRLEEFECEARIVFWFDN